MVATSPAELFLPRETLVTYTQGRERPDGRPNRENMRYKTQARPVLPEGFPIIILVNRHTASSSEIVTGALQFHQRAIIVGEKTFGKGSVQTIIPLNRPENTALRLTTALYYTPADVTIDLRKNNLEVHHARSEPWRITMVETGADTMTGGRLRAVRDYLTPGEPFCFTYYIKDNLTEHPVHIDNFPIEDFVRMLNNLVEMGIEKW